MKDGGDNNNGAQYTLQENLERLKKAAEEERQAKEKIEALEKEAERLKDTREKHEFQKLELEKKANDDKMKKAEKGQKKAVSGYKKATDPSNFNGNAKKHRKCVIM